MPEAFDKYAPIYGNIIDEAKNRLEMVARALAPEVQATIGYIAVSDLCCLQFRKTFEAIALGCLLVHGALPETKRLRKDTYRADKLLAGLERLHSEFYPVPCKFVRLPNGIAGIDRNKTGDWLTKARLRRLYFQFDHEMHVGTLSRRQLLAEPVGVDSLTTILRWTRTLISTHFITLPGGAGDRIVCEANPIGVQPMIHSVHRQ